MFCKKYKRLDEDISVINYQGIFRRRLTLFQAVALIVSATIGAGILGIPYAISKVGLTVGIIYIVALGLIMMMLNLMLGEVAARTNSTLQLVGLANKYLGRVGGWIMTVLFYVMLLGILTIYIIGEGEALSALFGGSNFVWSLVFFVVGSALIFVGLRTIKTVEFVLSLGILFVVLLIAAFSFPHVEMHNVAYSNLAFLLFPYGVILFAFNGTNSIPEAHRILSNTNKNFKLAIIISGLINISVYTLFAFMVVGVTGSETTELATIGLGNKLGSSMHIFGNVFAVVAMASSFLMAGLALRDSMRWDYKMPSWLASSTATFLPLLIFLAGFNSFIMMIDIVGGIFVGSQLLIVILIYWRAKSTGHLKPTIFNLHHAWLIMAVLILAFTFGAVYSVVKLF